MNLCVIGTGYVGLVTGACFAEFGNRVFCVDNDPDKLASLEAGKVPFYEPGLEDLVARNKAAGRLTFTDDLGASLKESLVAFLAVGTPRGNDGRADLRSVEAVAKEVGSHLEEYKVIVTKSTVPAGTGQKVRQWIEETAPTETKFSVASNPEFLREGSAIEDFLRPNRVVIGTEDEQSTAILKDLYRPLFLIETPFVVTDLITAEIIKYASNAFLAVKISYINEMANLCESVGADVHVVARAMGLDRRIGPKFLHPGPGFGGSCLPKDTRALMAIAEEYGERFNLVESAVKVNDERTARMISKIESAVGEGLEGKTVALLGLTFKPNTDDLRDSPALAVLDSLLEKGATVRAYDPAGMEAAKAWSEKPGVSFHKDEYDAAQGADVLTIATEWNPFRFLDWDRMRGLLNQAAVADLRNVYEPNAMEAAGFRYVGVGRG